jgi:hypothetical protein
VTLDELLADVKKMSKGERRAVLAELLELLKMDFEEMQAYRALPFTAKIVDAWIAGIEKGTSKEMLSAIVKALAAETE